MQKFDTLTGVAAPLPIDNVDTDMIIPKQYLKTIKRTGLGKGLFSEMRYNDDGSENPDFVLNKPAYRARQDPRRRRQFRLRLVARACALGAARFRHPLRDLDRFRRHFLQQLLQERHPADQGQRRGSRQADGRRRARRQRDADRRPRAQEIRGPDGGVVKFESTRSASTACSKGLDDIGLTMSKRRRSTPTRAKAASARPWA